MRPSWEEYALNLALAASERSEDPYIKVGACALNEENMVLGVGYNGLASGKGVGDSFWGDRHYRRPFMIHAEVNCLSLFKKGEAKLLACTLMPCASCATMIASYGIETVIYKDIYHRDTKALNIFDFYGIKCVKKNLTNMTKLS
jgi:dCMP deaminase